MTPTIYLTAEGKLIPGPIVRLSQVLDQQRVSLKPPLPEAHIIAAMSQSGTSDGGAGGARVG